MSGRDPAAKIPADFQCDYAPKGQQACSPAICDCFVADYPDDPFGLHPEAFVVAGPLTAEPFQPPTSPTHDGAAAQKEDHDA